MSEQLEAAEYVAFHYDGRLMSRFTKDNIEKRREAAMRLNIFQAAARQAFEEVDWVGEKCIYISVKSIIPYKAKKPRDKEVKEKQRLGLLVPRTKDISPSSLGEKVVTALKGIAYKDKSDIVGLIVTKEYGDDYGVDVVVGAINTTEEMYNDMQKTQAN